MPQFSDNDINEAKRRVWEMRNRASHFVDDAVPTKSNVKETHTEEPKAKAKEDKGNIDDEKKDDKSFFVILALILILSQEGADNNLILALLYLLL